jgi:hypothetical protein
MDIFSIGFHLFFVLIALGIWKSLFFPSIPLLANRRALVLWLTFMFVCALVVYIVLTRWSAPSVRDSAEVSFYLVFSMISIALAQGVFAFLGISLRDDMVLDLPGDQAVRLSLALALRLPACACD